MDVPLNHTDTRRIAVLQHVPCEPPAAYGTVLEKYAPVETFLLGRDQVPDLVGYDAIVAMGGPMGVYDTEEHPWLRAEVAAIENAIRSGSAVWGVCLGAQLLAAATGGRVYRGTYPEVGVATVDLTPEAASDRVFAETATPLPVLQWHGDTFDLPPEAVLLAEGTGYRNQAFRVGRSYGLQFHLESSADLAEEWLELPAYRSSLVTARGPDGARLLREELRAVEADMASAAESLVARWLETLL